MKIPVQVPSKVFSQIQKLREREEKVISILRGNKSLWIIIVSVLLILAVLPSYYFYHQYKETKMLLQNPQANANAEAKTLINKVSQLMVLPENEQPTIATVSDITKLSDQPFFANAKNGDKVLIYTQSKKAILYRESINKIIEVAPVNLGSSALTPTAVPTVAPVFKLPVVPTQ